MSNIDDEVDSFFADMLQEENVKIQNLGERYQEKDFINQSTYGLKSVKESQSKSANKSGGDHLQDESRSTQRSLDHSLQRQASSSTDNGTSSVPAVQNQFILPEEAIQNPQQILQSIQRDLNRLSSQERGVRLNAMQKLKPILRECFMYLNVSQYLFRFINSVFIKLLEDELESLREFGCEILFNLFHTIRISDNSNEEAMKDISEDGTQSDIVYSNSIRDQTYECLALLIPVLTTKLLNDKHTLQAKETSEEVRVLMMSLFSYILCHFEMSEYLKLVYKVLRDRLEDNYHQIKRDSCSCIVALCHVNNGKYKYYLDNSPVVTKLIKAISSSLNHQRHGVRAEAVNALYELVMIRPGGDSLKDLSKTIRKLASDNSKEVRLNLLNVCEKWFINHIDTYSYQDIFIAPILIMHSDEFASIQEKAMAAMDRLGQKHEEWNEEKLKDQLEYIYEDMSEESKHLPPPFTKRPRLGSRLIVKHNLKTFLTLIFDNLGDWSIQQKSIYSQLLKVMIVYCEKDITQHMDKMLQNWFKIVSDQELEICQFLEEGIRLAGRYADPDSYLPHIYSFLQSQYATSPGTLTNVLKVFTLLLEGTTIQGRNMISSNHKRISTELQASHLLYHEDKRVVAGVLEVVQKLLQMSTKIDESEGFEYFFLLHKIWAQNSNRVVSENEIPQILDELSRSLNLGGAVDLYKLYFKTAVDLLVETRDLWEKTSPELYTFELVVKKGIVQVSDYSSFIFSHLKTLTQKGRDGFVVAVMFSIMEHMFKTVGDRVKDDIEVILFDIIGPNLPWTSGKSKLKSRMLGFSCLNVILSQNLCSETLLKKLVAEYHSSIVSMLDEFDDQMRLLSTRMLPQYLEKTSHFLKEKDWESCYKVLVELFDDKLDQVRIQSINALRTVFICCPYDFKNVTGPEAFKKLIETLLIHIDDTNHEVQHAVFETVDMLRQTDSQRGEIVKDLARHALHSREFQTQHTKFLLQRWI